MKTTPDSGSKLPRAALAASLLATTASLFALVPQIAAATDAPKDHVLFVGTELAVKQDGNFYRVVGADSDKLQIERDHGARETRSLRGAEIQISRGVKMSNLSATIDNLKSESSDRAAARAQLDAMRSSMLMSDDAADAADRLQGAVTLSNSVATDPSLIVGGGQSAAAQAAARTGALNDYATKGQQLDAMSATASNHFTEQIQNASSPEVEISFDVSSPVPIENAYVVVVANYTSPSGDKVAREVAAQKLAHLDSHPTRVRVSHAASVAGLAFKKFDLGLFANGQEVATNLSEKRMALTADQAYQFFLIGYLSSHTGATRPPAPMLMTPRTEFRRQVPETALNQEIYAQVDKSGAVVELSGSENGSEKLPPAVATALQNVRFMPALQNGERVDGRLKLTLAELVN